MTTTSSSLNREFLFIIGAPRSGTTWLQAMLGAHPDVCTTVELTLFNVYIAPWLKAWRTETAHMSAGRWQQGLPVLWTESDLLAFLREFLDRVYTKLLESKPDATHILDKQPNYTACIDDIRLLLPQAKFIHIIRDGRDVAASLVAAYRDMGFGSRTIRDAAHVWRSSVEQARGAKAFAGNYFEIRYEDLLTSPQDWLQKTFDFLHLSADDAEIDRIVKHCAFEKMKVTQQSPAVGIKELPAHFRKGMAGGWKDDFGPMDRFDFDRIAGGLLKDLGYADENWWAPTPAQRLRLFCRAVPAAVVRRFRNTAAHVNQNDHGT
jgi:hypothetical protein